MGNDLTAVDEERTRNLVWKSLGRKSVSEIAELTGMKPNEVLALSREILTSVDALTIEQQIAKALIDLNEIAVIAREAFEDAEDDRAKAPLLAASITAIKTGVGIIKDLQKQTGTQIERLNELRIRELREMVSEMATLSAKQLSDSTGLSQDEIMQVFMANLMQAAQNVEDRNLLP